MQFRIRSTPVGHDVPLASVYISDVLSNDVVQLMNFSSHIENNMTSAVKQMSSEPKYSDGNDYHNRFALRARSSFGSIEITNEYHYDRTTGAVTPMWYMHSLQRSYYNPDILQKSIKRNIRTGSEQSDRVITAMIPVNGDYVILGDSVSIKKSVGVNQGWLSYKEYYVNYGEGSLSILSDISEAGSQFEIRYTLVPIDLSVTTFDNSPYRIELHPSIYSICTTCGGSGCDDCYGKGRVTYASHYTVSILSPSTSQILVSYRSFVTTTRVEEVSEYTNSAKVFNAVGEEVRRNTVVDLLSDWEIDPVKYRVFSRENDPTDYRDIISVTTDNPDEMYTFRSNTKYNTRIRLVKPYSLGFMIDWFPQVTEATVRQHDGTVYSTESQVQSRPISVSEIATIVDPNTLSVSIGNIYAMYTSDFRWYGVTVKRSDGTELEVDSVDIQNGLIHLIDNVSRREIINVLYYTRPIGRGIYEVCLNPLSTHGYHNVDIKNKIVLYIIADSSAGDLPIYVKILDKYRDNELLTYTYEDLNAALNAESNQSRKSFRSDIAGLPSKYKTDTFTRLELLGLLYVINPLDEDGYLIEDARLFGGGTPIKHRSFYDHSYFDGEACDMESYLVYRVPQWIVDDLAERALIWNPDTVMADDPNSHAVEAAEDLIRKKIKKFSQLGTRQEIIIE